MGERVEPSALVVDDDAVQRRLERCVAVLRRMVDDGWFGAHEDTVGMEVELDLVDPLGRPRLINDAVLARLGRADMQHELGQFNVGCAPGLRELRLHNGTVWGWNRPVYDVQAGRPQLRIEKHEMTRRYVEHAHTGARVHEWPVS